jgi:outer membrane protein OmpA-like peptidoglycan-associated protein
MKTKIILLCSVALALGACSSQSGPRYTPRADVAQKNYTSANHAEDRMDKKSYRQYEQREPCQNYRKLPRGMIDRCARAEEEDTELGTAQIVRSYTVMFDHDSSGIRASEEKALDRIMREIDKYNPKQVTVTGYTDSSGEADYNQSLSRKREQAVSMALLSRGVENQTLERKARGEYEQAVETKDGVRNQSNRRVVIDFRR